MKKIVIVGAGVIGVRWFQKLDSAIVDVIEFWDNSLDKQGTTIMGIPVRKPYSYNLDKDSEILDAFVVAVSHQYRQEIREQLISLGIPDEKIFHEEDYMAIIELLAKYRDTSDLYIKKSLDYIRVKGLRMYNDSFVEKYHNMEVCINRDELAGCYYAVINGKKMYLKSSFSKQQCEDYVRELLLEQDEESPHRYLSERFNIKQGSVVVDAGAAEGVFALDIIDRVGKAILIECDEEWIEALRYTFAPYRDKVVIVDKMLGKVLDECNVTLDALCESYAVDFVKMDIEGAEQDAIAGGERYLKSGEKMKLAVCTYHRPEDAKAIYMKLNEYGYKCEFTDGYVYVPKESTSGLIVGGTEFRKAVICAEN